LGVGQVSVNPDDIISPFALEQSNLFLVIWNVPIRRASAFLLWLFTDVEAFIHPGAGDWRVVPAG
jgi:hypothetical protein